MSNGIPMDADHVLRFAYAEFIEKSGVSEERVAELLDLGWLVPCDEREHTRYFRQMDIYRTRKVDRLCLDFEIPSLAGAIIVDLLERIDDMEARLRETGR